MAEQPAAGSTRRHATLAIIGLPNAGKSTLLNALLGQKLAATSQIPQTTRTRVLGVVDRGDVQLAFLDTPGIHLPKHALNERMMAHVEQALEESGPAHAARWLRSRTPVLLRTEGIRPRTLKGCVFNTFTHSNRHVYAPEPRTRRFASNCFIPQAFTHSNL